MGKKLTPNMQRAFEAMPVGKWVSAYELRISRSTLNALCERGLIKVHVGLGAGYSPSTAIQYKREK